MSDPKQEILDVERELPRKKQAYEDAMKAFLAHPQDAARVTLRRQALQEYHSAAVAYFNLFEQLISLGSLTGADRDPTWYTDKADTSANLLDTIHLHFQSVFAKADELHLSRDAFKPSQRAYANMQRLVKAHDAAHAATLRALFHNSGLPTHGFDRDESEKSGTRHIEWRFFIVGCVSLLAAIGMACWGFSLTEMKPHHYFILRWLLPLASAFTSGSFTGSLVTGSRKWHYSLAIAATGGFAVWLLATLFLSEPGTGPAPK